MERDRRSEELDRKNKTYSLKLQIMTRSVKRNQKVQLKSRKTALWLRGFVKLS